VARDGFEFTPGGLGRNLRAFDGDLNALIAGVVDFQGPKSVARMKTTARWTDRTGNARATLAGFAEHTDRDHKLILHGGVPYQWWLEVRWRGKYAIVWPTTIWAGKAIMRNMNRLIAKMKGVR
jgi:hypothetical protein